MHTNTLYCIQIYNTLHPTTGKSSFWKGLSSLINRTPSKTVANFLVFNVVYNTVGYLSQGQFGAIVDKFVTVSV